ncbi:MAG TPA: hypothetical protein H9875_07510 [Candidatus Levilactobacillus faecigallinarum]|uniref:Uncharacterized protein n=1 Tax=Candidatus Levilactobacillus faecigallinarum TaxID=2838638 RepID=A0A9D1QTN3_9LACO|nr:hypothetical protein [Candidatus Levilactobacillus faecigallinarum]
MAYNWTVSQLYEAYKQAQQKRWGRYKYMDVLESIVQRVQLDATEHMMDDQFFQSRDLYWWQFILSPGSNVLGTAWAGKLIGPLYVVLAQGNDGSEIA